MKQNYRNPMKTLLASIAFLLVGGGISNAQVTFSFKAGSTSTVNPSESAEQAFDGNTGTKWCAYGSGTETDSYLTLEASEETYIKGFTMTTANDNAGNPGRTPKEYYIKGSTDNENWEVIYYQVDDNLIEDVNYKTYTVYCNCTKKYKYFRLWVKDSNINGGTMFQISEFSLIPGTVGFTKNDGSAEAIDGQTSVKWQGNPTQTLILESTEEGGAYITGYQFTTGNDNASWKGRNPKNWTISGSNDKSNWTVLDDQTNNFTMGDVNYYPYAFQLPSATDVPYKYVKIEVTSTIGGGYFQLSEVAVLGTTAAHSWSEVGECATRGGKIYVCSECGGQKIEGSTEIHTYADGICTYCGKAKADYMTANGEDFYEISNAAQLKWFAAFVNDGNAAAKGKLTADIDMNFNAWTPIGKSSSTKFSGTFDGDGHTISKLSVKTGESNIGLFGYVTGDATIKNLWIDKTCSFIGTAKVGGIAGMADGGGTVTLLNVVNAAPVTSTGNTDANAAGFIGCCVNNTTVNATNCINAGNVKGQDGQCAAFTGWSQGGSTYTNCANIATINNMDGNKNLYRNTASLVDCYDASPMGTGSKTQGISKESGTVVSGALCFLLNGLVSGGTTFYQTVGKGHPVPFGTERVYATGTFKRDGTIVDTPTYSNSVAYPTYVIENGDDLAWFAGLVNEGSTGAGARLAADINLDGVAFTPIGTDANRYNGTFDGQGHRIKNLSNNTGVFGYVSGASTDTWIKNLIIDSSCSFVSTGTVAALAANTKGSGAIIHMHNIVNEANVSTSGQNASALIGTNGDNSQFDIQNCVNTGDITSTSNAPYAGVVAAWMGVNGNTVVKNIINLGTITGYNGSNRMGRFWFTPTNMIDPNAASGQQGYKEGISASDAATGKIAYLANQAAGENVFFQTIGTDDYPSPLNEGTVYQTAVSGSNSYYANVASGATIASMTLTDAADYAADANFTATSLTYNRTLVAGGYHSLCLPFAVTTTMLGEGSKLFTVKTVGTDAITLEETPSVPAGTPCFASVTSDFNFNTLSLTDVEMKATVSNGTNVKGTFTEITGDGAVGIYKLSGDGTYFGLTDNSGGAVVKPFRSYIQPDGAGVKTLNILLSDGTSLTPTLSEEREAVIYDLAGRRVEKATKGLYIINGKKVVK